MAEFMSIVVPVICSAHENFLWVATNGSGDGVDHWTTLNGLIVSRTMRTSETIASVGHSCN